MLSEPAGCVRLVLSPALKAVGGGGVCVRTCACARVHMHTYTRTHVPKPMQGKA